MCRRWSHNNFLHDHDTFYVAKPCMTKLLSVWTHFNARVKGSRVSPGCCLVSRAKIESSRQECRVQHLPSLVSGNSRPMHSASVYSRHHTKAGNLPPKKRKLLRYCHTLTHGLIRTRLLSDSQTISQSTRIHFLIHTFTHIYRQSGRFSLKICQNFLALV